MTFTDVTAETGIAHLHYHEPTSDLDERAWLSAGAVAEDFNGDGWVDLFALTGGFSLDPLYINQGDGTFADEAGARGLGDAIRDQAMSAAAADYDNDGDVDLIITYRAVKPELYLNDGTGQFSLATSQVFESAAYRAVTSPSWGDIDNDGFLDLAFGDWSAADANFWIYRNDGAGQLILHNFRLIPFIEKRVFAPRFADMNGDRLPELLLVCDFGNSQYYVNVGEGKFARQTSASGACTDQNGMGSAIGDYDNDGDLDWFVTSIYDMSGTVQGNWGTTGNRLYRNNGDGTFVSATTVSGTRDGNWGWGASFGDLDLDGDLDIYHVNGWCDHRTVVDAKFNNQPARLFENLGNGTFIDAAAASGAADTGQGRGVILFDYDNDGDLDIFIGNNQETIQLGADTVERRPGSPRLLRNDTATLNYGFKVSLAGRAPLHSHGIGSRVLVSTSSGPTQTRELHASTNYMAQEPGRIAHFGLNRNSVATEVRAEWVNGDATLRENVAADQWIVLTSPGATVDRREALAGQIFSASGADAKPTGTPREWIIEGQTYADPVEIAFSSAGTKELRLNVYEADGQTLHRAEILRVTVTEGPASGPSGWMAR
jgi:hypothetical protein